jgi:hypothetical protein
MNAPRSPSPSLPTAFHPEPLLAVSCPGCLAAIAVEPRLLGQPADCPLCGRGFRVPTPVAADTPRQPEPSSSPSSSASPSAELHFQEPVRTVSRGDRVVTLRSRTPEERARRRTRRNLMMMVGGVSILMAIVLFLGPKRPK